MNEEIPTTVEELAGSNSSEIQGEIPVKRDEAPTAEAPQVDVEPAVEQDKAQENPSNSSEEKSPTETTKKPKRKRTPKEIPLKVGQKVNGKVKTITDFGAFVGIDNLSQDGLLHISELAVHRVEKVEDIVSVGDAVTVWVKNVDQERGRIGLTLIEPPTLKYSELEIGDVHEGEVKRIEDYGVFVDIGLEREGFVHISELSHDYIQKPGEVVQVGDNVEVKVLKINSRRKQVNLSLKALQEAPEPEAVEGIVEEVVDEWENEEPLQTAMAAAFSQLRPARESAKKDKRRNNPSMEDVVSRTLQQREEEN